MKKQVKTLKEYLANKCSIPTDELNALKNKYGKIKVVSVVPEEPSRDAEGNILNCEVYFFALRRPNKGQVRMLTSFAKQRKEDEFIESAIKNLVVGGDMEALEDGIVYMGVASQIDRLLKPYESFLVSA